MWVLVFFICYFVFIGIVLWCRVFCENKKIQPEKYIVVESPDKIEIGIVSRL